MSTTLSMVPSLWVGGSIWRPLMGSPNRGCVASTAYTELAVDCAPGASNGNPSYDLLNAQSERMARSPSHCRSMALAVGINVLLPW